jgi:hypothetical protein
MLHIGLLLFLIAVPQDPVAGASGFRPDVALRPPGGPDIALFTSVPPEVVSLRVSVPLRETSEEAGAGKLIEIQARARMQSVADRIGARAEVHRTPDALVYEVAGTPSDVDFLGWVLREGLRPPSEEGFEPARRTLRAELERLAETPQGLLFLLLRTALANGGPSIFGTPASLDRLDPSRVQAVWARSHRRGDVRIVVAGQLPIEVILAAVGGLGLPEEGPVPTLPPSQALDVSRPDPEVIRHWLALAYPLPADADAAALVTARWIAEVVRDEAARFESGVEIWDVQGQRVLVLSGAAYPQDRAAAVRALEALPRTSADRLTGDAALRLAQEARAEIELAGRTAWGLTELVGQAWDVGRGPDGVDTLLSDLAGLQLDDVALLLETLAASSPLREELAP